jgi:Abnormal spindle-like microcephaly-assoc'd, ASPM-SPD-2-Hydin
MREYSYPANSSVTRLENSSRRKNYFSSALLALIFVVALIPATFGLSGCAGYTSAANKNADPPAVGAMLSANVSSVSFGTVPLGGMAAEPIIVTNVGSEVAQVSESSSGSGFSFVAGASSFSIPAGQSVTIDMRVTPQAPGPFQGTFTLSWNTTQAPITVPFSGTAGAKQGQLNASPAVIDFGSMALGSSNTQLITLANVGNSALTLSGASVTGTGFTIAGLASTLTIAPGRGVTFNCVFQPTAAGAVTGAISVGTDTSGVSATIALSGTGTQAELSATPSSVSFGTVSVGSPNSQAIMLQNPGNGALTFSKVSVTGSGFSVTGLANGSSIAAGGNLAFDAVFGPTANGAVTGSITLVSNGTPSQLTIPLSGTGQTATHSLSANPSSLNFNSVTIGNTASLNSTITNNGNSNVTISGVSATSAFAASGLSSGTTLQPNQSATLTVVFKPATAGAVSSAAVSITSNGTALTIPLAGTGQAAASHSVALSWAASSSTGITGYYVYRGTTPGQYAKINPSAPVATSQLSYTDGTVQGGTTYYYVVTAVDSSNVESSFSNSVTANVPN